MEHAVKNWWLSLILGILYIIVALCLLFAPGSSYIALSVIFSISMLISGIIEIIFSINGMGKAVLLKGIQENWVTLVQGGALVVAIAFIIVNIIVDVLYLLINPRIRSV